MGGMRGLGGGMSDDFFGSNFGGNMMMNMDMGGFGGGQGQSISKTTIVKNGKSVTVTKKQTQNSDGTTRTEVHEEI